MPEPTVRASDAERERVADVLRLAAAEGRLQPDELEERLAATYAARTRDELVPLTADLPAHAPPPAPAETGAGRATAETARWTRARVRERAAAWLIPNLICLGVWLASGGGGNFWPRWVLLFTTIAFIASIVRPDPPSQRD